VEQRFCDVCGDTMPLDMAGTTCDECQAGIETLAAEEIGFVDEEILECETPAAAVVPSSSAMPESTTPAPAPDKSTSKSDDASSVVVDTGWDDLDFPTPATVSSAPSPQTVPDAKAHSEATAWSPASEEQQDARLATPRTPSIGETINALTDLPLPSEALPGVLPEVVAAVEATKEATTACEACGFIQKHLHSVKTPNMKEPILMCDVCFAGEMALVNEVDDPMQGKIVHPDEAQRAEVMTMDDDDRILYNDEVLINAATPIEEVEARVNLLERRLHRAKLQLKASRTVLLMRVESMKKEEKDKYYREAGVRIGQRKRKAQGDGTGTVKKVSPQQRRNKIDKFREDWRANGFTDEWIDGQLKKMGWM